MNCKYCFVEIAEGWTKLQHFNANEFCSQKCLDSFYHPIFEAKYNKMLEDRSRRISREEEEKRKHLKLNLLQHFEHLEVTDIGCMYFDLLNDSIKSNNMNPKIVEKIKSAVVDMFLDSKTEDERIEYIKSELMNDDNYFKTVNNIDLIIDEVIIKNESAVQKYKSGKTNILGFFISEVLKQCKSADPKMISDIIKNRLQTI